MSLRFAIAIWFTPFVISSLLGFLANGLTGLFIGSFLGLFLLSGIFGAFAFVQHFALRLVLILYHITPLNYVKFLDFCVERILLRRVGGGWIFVHRLLLDYFADLAPALGVASEEQRKPLNTPDAP